MATLLPSSLQTSEGIGSPGISSCVCKLQFLPRYASLQTRGSNKMKAWNGEVNWYCPKEQSLMANVSGDWWRPSFPLICLSVEVNLWMKPQSENWPDWGLNWGLLGERQRRYPSPTAVVDMHRAAWYPESSCPIEANLKKVDRQWIAQELVFYFINMPFRAVQFDNITSKFDSVASFCCWFA